MSFSVFFFFLFSLIEIEINKSFSFLSQVDSANKHGKLLEMVQVLTDLDLVISKSYISSDGGWLMDGNLINSYIDFSN